MKKLLSRISLTSFLILVILLVTTFTLPCAPAQAASGPQCWALIVDSSASWSSPDTEANNLNALLSPVWGSSHINLITGSQATKAGILNGVSWLVNNAGADDTVLCFFTSHLYGINEVTHLGVILTYDFPSSGWNDSKTISSVELQTAFSSLHSSKVFIVINAGAAARFANLDANGRVVLMSCGSTLTSTPISGWAKTFVSGFASFDTTDANHDYELSAEETAKPMTTSTLSDLYNGELPLLEKFTFATETGLPSGTTVLTLDGVNYTSPPAPQLWIPGSSHTISVPQTVSVSSDTRFNFAAWNDATTSTAKTVSKGAYTASYNKEFLLSLTSPFGTLSGAGWYKSGTTANISVTSYIETSDTKHYFTSWSGGYTGTAATATVAMTGPKSVTANWRHEYLLTLNSEFGIPTGAGWYKQGDAADISVASEQGFLIRHIFNGWTGDLTQTQASTSVTMDGPKTVTATWRTDYLQLYILIIIVVVLAGGAAAAVILIRRRRVVAPAASYTPPASTPPTPPAAAPPPPPPPTAAPPPPPPPPPPAK